MGKYLCFSERNRTLIFVLLRFFVSSSSFPSFITIVVHAKHQRSTRNVLLRFSEWPPAARHVGKKFHKLLFFVFPCSSSSVPPDCQSPCLLETIESEQTVHHQLALSWIFFSLLLLFCVFFSLKQRKRRGTLHPADFLPPPGETIVHAARQEKETPTDFGGTSASSQPCAPIREAFNLLQTLSPPAPPRRPRGGNKPPRRCDSALHVWMDYVTITHSFLSIQSQSDVHVSAKQSITDPVPTLFRM